MILWPDTGDPDWPAYATEHGHAELGLAAVALIGGKAVATEAAWRDFQSANAANDRNGTYNTESIEIAAEGMKYQWEFCGDPQDFDVIFPRVEMNAPDGSPLYLFDGDWISA